MNTKKVVCLLTVVVCGLLVANPVWGAAGDLLWEQSFNYPPYTYVEVNSMVATPTRFVIAGFAGSSQGIGVIGFIKAFNAATGAPEWGHTNTEAAPGAGVDIYNNYVGLTLDRDLLITRTISYIQPVIPNPIYTLYKNTIRCYIADTGQQLWEVPTNFETNIGNGPETLVVANNRVFNVAFPIDTSGHKTGDIVVRAYQERNVALAPSFLLLD